MMDELLFESRYDSEFWEPEVMDEMQKEGFKRTGCMEAVRTLADRMEDGYGKW